MFRRFCAMAIVAAGMILVPWGGEAAPRLKDPASDVDPSLMRIDEVKYLGAKLDGDTVLVGSDGRETRLADLLGRPLILVLAYYTCDGSCSVINSQLMDLLPAVKRVVPGEDYRILTLSFDKHDNLETTGAYKKHLANIRGFEHAWTFATFKNETDLTAQTEKIGFKFFWSFNDRMFLHPGVFLFLTADGRLARVLYPPVESQDIELGVYDAKQGDFQPREIIKYAINLCYSYSFADGKYVLNIPIFVGAGAFLLGFASLWDEARDARLYAGSWPVVAHPPCQRWGKLWAGQPLWIKRTGERKSKGDDGGCFEAGLVAARRWGGVLEHPADSHAWVRFGLNKPPRKGGWVKADEFGGWACCVEQGQYGDYARKPTWLLVYGIAAGDLPELRWGKSEPSFPPEAVEKYGLAYCKRAGELAFKGGGKDNSHRIGTPTEFRDLLICMAATVAA